MEVKRLFELNFHAAAAQASHRARNECVNWLIIGSISGPILKCCTCLHNTFSVLENADANLCKTVCACCSNHSKVANLLNFAKFLALDAERAQLTFDWLTTDCLLFKSGQAFLLQVGRQASLSTQINGSISTSRGEATNIEHSQGAAIDTDVEMADGDQVLRYQAEREAYAFRVAKHVFDILVSPHSAVTLESHK